MAFPEQELVKGHISPEQLNCSTTDAFSVGGIYFKQAQNDRGGLICATLSKDSIRLKSLLQEDLSTSVEAVPLIAVCLTELLKNSEDSLVFEGVEQFFYLEKSGDILTKYFELPDFGNISSEDFVYDQLPISITPKTINLLPKENMAELSGRKNKVKGKNIHPESFKINNAVEMESVISEWSGFASSLQKGF